MNGKQAKKLRRLSKECSIGYRPLKHVYNKLCQMDEVREKTLLKQDGGQTDGAVPTQDTPDKEAQ